MISTDEKLISKVNTSFYRYTSDRYEESHPEVFEGCSFIWKDYFSKYPLEKPISIIDIGCGTGFVYQLIQQLKIPCTSFIGLDSSKEMLDQMAKCRGTPRPIGYVADVTQLPSDIEPADLVTVNSAIHHFPRYKDVLRSLPQLVKPNGLLIIGHEPSKSFYSNQLVRYFSSLYMKLGFGKNVNIETAKKINKELLDNEVIEKPLSREEIIRMVEFNSPTDQFLDKVDTSKGFLIGEIDDLLFPMVKQTYCKTYTTFLFRRQLKRFFFLSSIANMLVKIFFGGGNQLFLVYQKVETEGH